MRTNPGYTMGVHGALSLATFVLVITHWQDYFATACNIDVDPARWVRYTNNEPGSFFGYTTIQHKNSFGTWILVGAPRGQSGTQPSLERPGALYRCQVVRPHRCYKVELDLEGNQNLAADQIIDVKDNQWLGVSLARQTNKDRAGDVTVCGHLWSNDYYVTTTPDSEGSDRYPNGICYVSNANFESDTIVKLRPCTDELQVNGTYRYHGSCQAGISAAYTTSGDKLIIGAVGSYEWNGTVLDVRKNRNRYQYNIRDLSDWPLGQKGETEYLGYSVSSGNFKSTTMEQGVTGAPRSKEVGKVFIYDLDTFQVYAELKGEKMNAYFGSTVLGVDLNNDGLSDLLVGAPFYSVNQDEGRVYVYINKGEAKMEPLDFMLEGSNAIGGRFGSTIALMKDVNLDGFYDVAIAAPYEDKNTGAVYIYRGDSSGIRRMYSQRIAARELFPGMLSFGSSLAGGMDVDGNNYPDLVVGLYANDTVVLFKTLPVVKLRVWIEVSPESLDPEYNNCKTGRQKITCLTVSACFDYTPENGLPDEIKFDYNLEVDLLKTDIGATSRLYLLEDGGDQTTAVAATVTVTKSGPNCFPHIVYLKKEARDFLTPLMFLLNYNIFDYPYEPPRGDTVTSPFPGGLAPVLDDYQCSNGTANKKVFFVSECGNDSICQTNLKVMAYLSVQSGNLFITLGGDSVVYLRIEVQNQGEEAHQTELLITHPREVVYESLELRSVDCLGSAPCIPDNMVSCEPRESFNATSAVFCSVGNPMRSRTASILRIRFDVGGMAWGRRVVDFTAKVTTLSIERNDNLHDNVAKVSLPVHVVADITVRGVIKPEQVFYLPDNETIDGKPPDKKELLTQALKAAEILDGGGSSDTKAIGPAFTHVYEIGNMGPGRLPFDSVITILLPWRAMNGDWLFYIRDIQLQGQGDGNCDTSEILQLQRSQMMEHYFDQSYTAGEIQMGMDGTGRSDKGEIGCDKAKCVTIRCNLQGPIISGSGAVVNIDMLLWQRTLIDNKLGSVDFVSTATFALQDTSMQPDNGNPNSIQLKTVVFTEEVPEKPVEPWIIAVSTIGGILGLIILIAALWKLGFFKRNIHDDVSKGTIL